ncbi:hypothetical protein QBC35DRAFT_385879 [Podospora australis]|uniref:Uncharacterized protein n=1 Tax=Podospora australis TaxID=1536484 RepID=A0AAN6WS52_9PEZI|nr:hypothetical protein QBC35DRAFT_385879 [Podospora australis]
MGFSPNYAGDILDRRNHSADIDPNQNCSILITDLPGDTTVKSLFSALASKIAPFDRVYACYVNGPDASRAFTTAAAKVVTLTRSGAEALYNGIASGRFVINDKTAKAVWNRIMVAPQTLPNFDSHVLVIQGHPALANLQTLEQFLGVLGPNFDTECVVTKKIERPFSSESIIEWRFGSYRAQAAAVKRVLGVYLPALKVRFGADPCARS